MASDGKVVSINGNAIPQTSKGDEVAIDVLRKLLAKAEAGEVIGVAVAFVYRDGCADNGWGGMLGSYSLTGAVECMKAKLVEIANGDD